MIIGLYSLFIYVSVQSLPWQSYISGTNGNNLHRLPPELVLTPHIYKINQKKKQIYTFKFMLINKPLLTSDYTTFCILLPCQKMKFLDSAWQAEIGG